MIFLCTSMYKTCASSQVQSLLFIFHQNRQRTRTNRPSTTARESVHPQIQLLRGFADKREAQRGIEPFLPDFEPVNAVFQPFQRDVFDVHNAQRSTNLLLRVDDCEVLAGRLVNFDLHGLHVVSRTYEGHAAAHGFWIPQDGHVVLW